MRNNGIKVAVGTEKAVSIEKFEESTVWTVLLG